MLPQADESDCRAKQFGHHLDSLSIGEPHLGQIFIGLCLGASCTFAMPNNHVSR